MRIMAIDYGDARTGVAVSDATCTLAGDTWVIHSKSMQEVAQKITGQAQIRDVSRIVVGYPKNMDGTVGIRAEKSEVLAEKLNVLCKAAGMQTIEIKLWDERLTTQSAHMILTDAGKRGKKRKNTVDAVAASLILESYMTSLKYNR